MLCHTSPWEISTSCKAPDISGIKLTLGSSGEDFGTIIESSSIGRPLPLARYPSSSFFSRRRLFPTLCRTSDRSLALRLFEAVTLNGKNESSKVLRFGVW